MSLAVEEREGHRLHPEAGDIETEGTRSPSLDVGVEPKGGEPA